MPTCFAPIIDDNTEILIIGTMPSRASLEAQQYYGFKHNAFWKIIAQMAGENLPEYSCKIVALRKLKLGLWDNLQYCERAGSLDSHIKNEIPNDFETLLKKYPKIQKLLFNGQKSYQFFKKYHPILLKKYNYAVLPSTSPANAGLKYEDKYRQWQREIKTDVSGR